MRKKFSAPLFAIVGLLLFSLAVYVFWRVEVHLKPTLMAIAEARATAIATQTINNVINDKVSRTIDPQTLVTVRFDSKGRVVLIQPNTMEFNKLAADTTIKVQDALHIITEEKIYIPIGQVLGSQILASWGPKILVTIIPVGTVQVKVVDKFEQAGINQTRHMVYLMATTQIHIVVPLVSKSISVHTQVPVAEYVVVGEVPNTYVQFPFPLPNDAHGGNGNDHS
ncbi:sporulation protein YunB [Thermosinus carboxydivorans]|uniref:sporulation protein YunB n=1 Tax=Thermosinus carboxydivorans TaxID=261685 RepID=UPI001E28DCA1|nr:sporulation protein YunB [Thermosinus carboxydivorans]